MNDLGLFWIQCEAERVGKRCINLFLWSYSEAQWAARHESLTGEWEWFFW